MRTETRPPGTGRRLGIFGVLAVIALVIVVVIGIRSREEANAKLRQWTDDQAVPTVAVALPDPKAASATLDLPGRLEAYYRAPIFARVSGYLKSWNADIGARVKAGQVIAEIEAPDLDQQLLQARADLASQEASAKLSDATLTRRKSLIASNFVSMQEIDERTADLSNKLGAVKAGQANVERLEALAGYKKITVPFDGVVTAIPMSAH
jgi:membrane fusion protein, multidrug efflux system